MEGIIRNIRLTPSGNISKRSHSVKVIVSATENSSIRLFVKNAAGNYYNFTSNTFASGFSYFKYDFTSNHVLKKPVEIPSVSSNDTYTFEIIAVKSTIANSTTPQGFSQTISQYVDSDAVFQLATDTSGDFSSFPSNVTSTNSPIVETNKRLSIDWTVTAQAAITGSALSIVRQPLIGDFYTQTSAYTANGSGSSATSLVLDSVSGLHPGMKLSSIDGTYDSNLRTITNVSGSTNTVTLSGSASWDNDEPIIFRVYGPELMGLHSGVRIQPETLSVTLKPTIKVVNGTTSSSTDVVLTDVTGIRTGEGITLVTSPSIVSDTNVSVASIVSFAGKEIRLSSAQSFKHKEVLTLQDCHPRPSFQNIYLINSLQLKLMIYFPKYYLKFFLLF